MRLYPPGPRRIKTAAGDLAAVLLVAVFALLGLWVHDTIAGLATLGRGVQDAGRGIEQAGTDTAASLRGATDRTAAEDQALDAARVVGWVTFLVPTLLLLSRTLPARVSEVRARTAAERMLVADGLDAERRRVLAERAAYSLPYPVLLRHARDPVGDLLAGRHDRLLAALAEDAGLPHGPATHPVRPERPVS